MMKVALKKVVIKYGITCVLLIVSMAGALMWTNIGDLQIHSLTLMHSGKTSQLASLPFKQDIIGHYRVSFSVNPGDRDSLDLRIIPDDELRRILVNGVPVSLEGFSGASLRDYNKGIRIRLELNANQDNRIELSLRNSSNPAGLQVKPLYQFSQKDALWLFACLCLLCFALFRHLNLTRMQKFCVLLGIVSCIGYLSVTAPDTRTFDVYEGGGHRDYIHYLIDERSLPNPGDGWEYHQPPLYYAVAALAKVLFVDQTLDEDFWAQRLALWFWVIFLVASLAVLRQAFGSHAWPLILASIAVCLWPSGIIHSIRIGNDLPLYAFYALSFYYLVRWWRMPLKRWLCWAAFWASMALLVKSNALAIWGVLGCLFLLRSAHGWWLHRQRELKRRQVYSGLMILGGFFLLSLTLNFGDNIWHYVAGESNDWLLSNVDSSINPRLEVANTPKNYLIFDLATYLQNPFISTWDDRYGRQYFWNFVWRSALTAEFFFDGETMRYWGLTNGVLLLMILTAIAVYGLQKSALIGGGRPYLLALYRILPWLLALIMPFLLLLAYRIKVPLSCNTDFRYIYPVLVPMIFFALRAWTSKRMVLAKTLSLAAPIIGAASIPWLWWLIN